MINGIKGFESNVSYYNTNTNLKENSTKTKQQLGQDSSKEQITQDQTINQTNENKLEENTKDIITRIKKTQSKEEIAKQKARFAKYFHHEVGWKTMDGENSTNKSSFQYALENVEKYSAFGEKRFEDLCLDKVSVMNMYWNTYIPLFENFDKQDASEMQLYQNSKKLLIDGTLVNKIISDITQNTNHFKEKELRVYIDDNSNVEAIDIRQY